MDHLQTRLEVLEQQTFTINRQLRWWRGLACGLIVLALLTWALPAGTAPQKSLEQRVAALETLLVHFSRDSNDVFITGANLHIVNGQGATTTTNELGNLIVGYNEPRDGDPGVRTGSHNVVVGQAHNFSRFGGLVVGDFNTISGDFAVVGGGDNNTASGPGAVVSGGIRNRAAVVSGGIQNTAQGSTTVGGAVVSGGHNRTALGDFDWVAGDLFEDE